MTTLTTYDRNQIAMHKAICDEYRDHTSDYSVEKYEKSLRILEDKYGIVYYDVRANTNPEQINFYGKNSSHSMKFTAVIICDNGYAFTRSYNSYKWAVKWTQTFNTRDYTNEPITNAGVYQNK